MTTLHILDINLNFPNRILRSQKDHARVWSDDRTGADAAMMYSVLAEHPKETEIIVRGVAKELTGAVALEWEHRDIGVGYAKITSGGWFTDAVLLLAGGNAEAEGRAVAWLAQRFEIEISLTDERPAMVRLGMPGATRYREVDAAEMSLAAAFIRLADDDRLNKVTES